MFIHQREPTNNLKTIVNRIQSSSDISLAKQVITNKECLQYFPKKPNEFMKIIKIVNEEVIDKDNEMPHVDYKCWINAAILYRICKDGKTIPIDLSGELLLSMQEKLRGIIHVFFITNKALIEGGCDVIKRKTSLKNDSPSCLIHNHKEENYISISNCVDFLVKLHPELFTYNSSTQNALVYFASCGIICHDFVGKCPKEEISNFKQKVEKMRKESLKKIVLSHMNESTLSLLGTSLVNQDETDFLFDILSIFPEKQRNKIIQNCVFKAKTVCPDSVVKLFDISENMESSILKKLLNLDNNLLQKNIRKTIAKLSSKNTKKALEFLDLLPQNTETSKEILENLDNPLPPLTPLFSRFLTKLIKTFPETTNEFFAEKAPQVVEQDVKWDEENTKDTKDVDIWAFPTNTGRCTSLNEMGFRRREEPMFACYTCRMRDDNTICLPCALECHKGHSLGYIGITRNRCTCRLRREGCKLCEQREEARNEDGENRRIHHIHRRNIEDIIGEMPDDMHLYEQEMFLRMIHHQRGSDNSDENNYDDDNNNDDHEEDIDTHELLLRERRELRDEYIARIIERHDFLAERGIEPNQEELETEIRAVMEEYGSDDMSDQHEENAQNEEENVPEAKEEVNTRPLGILFEQLLQSNEAASNKPKRLTVPINNLQLSSLKFKEVEQAYQFSSVDKKTAPINKGETKLPPTQRLIASPLQTVCEIPETETILVANGPFLRIVSIKEKGKVIGSIQLEQDVLNLQTCPIDPTIVCASGLSMITILSIDANEINVRHSIPVPRGMTNFIVYCKWVPDSLYNLLVVLPHSVFVYDVPTDTSKPIVDYETTETISTATLCVNEDVPYAVVGLPECRIGLCDLSQEQEEPQEISTVLPKLVKFGAENQTMTLSSCLKTGLVFASTSTGLMSIIKADSLLSDKLETREIKPAQGKMMLQFIANNPSNEAMHIFAGISNEVTPTLVSIEFTDTDIESAEFPRKKKPLSFRSLRASTDPLFTYNEELFKLSGNGSMQKLTEKEDAETEEESNDTISTSTADLDKQNSDEKFTVPASFWTKSKSTSDLIVRFNSHSGVPQIIRPTDQRAVLFVKLISNEKAAVGFKFSFKHFVPQAAKIFGRKMNLARNQHIVMIPLKKEEVKQNKTYAIEFFGVEEPSLIKNIEAFYIESKDFNTFNWMDSNILESYDQNFDANKLEPKLKLMNAISRRLTRGSISSVDLVTSLLYKDDKIGHICRAAIVKSAEDPAASIVKGIQFALENKNVDESMKEVISRDITLVKETETRTKMKEESFKEGVPKGVFSLKMAFLK